MIRIPSRRGRFAAYCALGWLTEVVFTGIHDYIRHRDPRLPARSHLYMGPMCGLMQPLYEPLHDALVERDVPAPARGAAYAVGFLGVEYATGVALRRALGDAPWDYSYAEGRNFQGLIRPDWFPMWAAAGLAMERVHDGLLGR